MVMIDWFVFLIFFPVIFLTIRNCLDQYLISSICILRIHQQINSRFRALLILFNHWQFDQFIFQSNSTGAIGAKKTKTRKNQKMLKSHTISRAKRIAHHLNQRIRKHSRLLYRVLGIKQITAYYFICFLIGHKTTLTQPSNEVKTKNKTKNNLFLVSRFICRMLIELHPTYII